MNLQIRNAIVERPIAAVVSSAIAMFGVAIGVVAWFHQERIAYITSKYEAEVATLRARLERAEGAHKPEANRVTAAESSTRQAVPIQTPPQTAQENQPPVSATTSQPLIANPSPPEEAYANVFSAGEPYPVKHSSARIGARLSSLKSIYPDGKVNSWGYDVAFREGPFSEVTFWMDNNGLADPPSTRISFSPRSESALKAIRASAAAAFQKVNHTAALGGARLVWRFEGITATLDEGGYELASSRP